MAISARRRAFLASFDDIPITDTNEHGSEQATGVRAAREPVAPMAQRDPLAAPAVRPQVYTTAEVCEIFRCSRTTIMRYVNAGYLVRPMRGRYTVASVEKLLAEGLPDLDKQHAPDPRRPARASLPSYPRLTALGPGKNKID
jgi:hypothetical protein